MPYIPEKQRIEFEPYIRLLLIKINRCGKWEGKLNYIITRLCDVFMRGLGINYKNANAIIGVLECAKQEIYRKVIAKYEDKKEAENGTVYGA